MIKSAISTALTTTTDLIAIVFYVLFAATIVAGLLIVLNAKPEQGAEAAFVITVFVSQLFYSIARIFKQRGINVRSTKAIEQGLPCALYLRSFAADTKLVFKTRTFLGQLFGVTLNPLYWFWPNSDTIEGILLGELKGGKALPIVAIGKDCIAYGATRLVSNNEDWKDKFISLAKQSRIIFCIPYPSQGSLFEIDWLIENALQKTIFILPDPKLTYISGKPYVEHWKQCATAFPNQTAMLSLGKKAQIFHLPSLTSKPRTWNWSRSNIRAAIRTAGIAI